MSLVFQLKDVCLDLDGKNLSKLAEITDERVESPEYSKIVHVKSDSPKCCLHKKATNFASQGNTNPH